MSDLLSDAHVEVTTDPVKSLQYSSRSNVPYGLKLWEL
jgi:hypothetical protein